MTTSSRPQRKKKPTDIFTPISREEEKSLMQALNISLRRIPLDGSVSDDDIGRKKKLKRTIMMIILMKKILQRNMN